MAVQSEQKSGSQIHDARRWAIQDQPLEFWHREALKRINTGPVLDLGCGDGLLLALLKDRGIKATGVDYSPTGVEKCKGKGLDVKLLSLDLEEGASLPFVPASFKVITILEVLEHLYFPLNLLKAAKPVLAPGGSLIISVPNFNSLPARVQVMIGSRNENYDPGKAHVYWMNVWIVRKRLRTAGFKIKEEVFEGLWPDSKLFAPVGTFLARLYPQLFALKIFVRAERL